MQLYIIFALSSALFLFLSISLGFAVFRVTVIRNFLNRLKTETEYSSTAYLLRLSIRYSRIFMIGSFLVSLVILYISVSGQNQNIINLFEVVLPVPLLIGIVYLLMETALFPLMNHYYEIARSMDPKKNEGIPVHVKVLQDKFFRVDFAVILLIILVLIILLALSLK